MSSNKIGRQPQTQNTQRISTSKGILTNQSGLNQETRRSIISPQLKLNGNQTAHSRQQKVGFNNGNLNGFNSAQIADMSRLGGYSTTTSQRPQSIISALQQEMSSRQGNFRALTSAASTSTNYHIMNSQGNHQNANSQQKTQYGNLIMASKTPKVKSSLLQNEINKQRVDQVGQDFAIQNRPGTGSSNNGGMMSRYKRNEHKLKQGQRNYDLNTQQSPDQMRQTFMQTMTNTNLQEKLGVHDRFCLCCNDHLKHHQSVRYKYPKMIQSAYLNQFKKTDLQDGMRSSKQDFNINKVNRNLFTSNNGQVGLLGVPNSQTSYLQHDPENYQVTTRFALDPKNGRSKSSFMHLTDIQPFIDTTTNKATFAFWPGNVAKPIIDKTELQGGLGAAGALKSHAKVYDNTQYNETFNKNKGQSQLDPQYNPDNLRQIFKSYSNFLVDKSQKLDGKTTKMEFFKQPEPENYIRVQQQKVKDSLQGMNGVKAPKEFYQANTKREYSKKKPQLTCQQRTNYKKKELFYN
eukprot:403333582